MRPKMTDLSKYHAHGLNVGLGIQSTAAALMCINRDLPRPDFFIFADTQWEREGTYENLEILKPLAREAGIPFHIVTGGNIREEQTNPAIARTELPYFCDPSRFATVKGKRRLLIKDIMKAYKKRRKQMLDDGISPMFDIEMDEYLEAGLTDFDRKVAEGKIKDGWLDMKVTQIGRQCTIKYKIAPVNRFCRKHYGANKKTPLGTWLGISTDEWTRMSSSVVKAFELFYPLIDYKYSRTDCETYLKDHDYPVPVKSACVGCPFHSDPLWKDMTDKEIADAGDYEENVNIMIKNDPSLKDRPYFANGVRLHSSMTPIIQRPFDKSNSNTETERDTVCGSAGCFL